MTQILSQQETGTTLSDEDQPTARLRKGPAADESPMPFGNGPIEPLEASAAAFKTIQQSGRTSHEAVDQWCDSFPGMRQHAELFRELHRIDPEAAVRLAHALTAMPMVGAEFHGFILLAELGRGGLARVFLAQQEALAHRHVVLKIAPSVWGEAETLAQLRHPNIVPILSVHQHEPFQAVCMPYLGWTTLQDVLHTIQAHSAPPTSGKVLINAFKMTPMGATQPTSPEAIHSSEFAGAISKMSYVEAVVKLAVQLSDGLAHAHNHGIVHHDLKPTNVLLADDGTPMLLDFNAAEDTKRKSSPMAAWVAGTFPYMAPERLQAFKDLSVFVDARSDLYAFGVILFELLTGRYPFKDRHPAIALNLDKVLKARRAPPPLLRILNPAVSPAFEAIVRRCLEADPTRRYQSARQLHEDLQCQLHHRPLQHIAEPSTRERIRKWTRRHARLLTTAGIGLCVGFLLVALSTIFVIRGNQLDQLAAQERERIQRQLERNDAATAWKNFEKEMKTAQFLLYTRTTEPDQLAHGLAVGKRLIQGYRVLDDVFWYQSHLVQALPDDERHRLAESMAELLLLTARALIVQHDDELTTDEVNSAFQQAFVMNERAELCSSAVAHSPALWHQRAKLHALLGQNTDAMKSQERAKASPLKTAADHYWAGSDLITVGQYRDALPMLQKAIHLEPSNFWAWFVLGNCCDRLALDTRAEACYATCIALKPDFHWAYFNRGLALYRQQNYRMACDDFDAVLGLRADLADAYLNRALSRQGLQQFKDAEQDLTAALDRGGPMRLYFLRARIRERFGDKAGAQADIVEAMRRPQLDEKSWIARGIHQLNHNPKAALADFEQALRLNPRSADALQNKAHVLAEKLRRNEESLRTLNRLVELYPDSVKARNGRGVVLARLGQREAAIRDAEETLRRDASPPRFYQVACIYALTSKLHTDDRFPAFRFLSSALRSGYGFQYLEIDTDLDPIRELPEFRRLADAARALRPIPLAVKKS